MKVAYLLAPLAFALSLAAPIQTASAQDYPPPPPQPYAQQRPPVTFGYANVLRVTPVYENYGATMEQQCDGPPRPAPKDTTGGTILGAVIGGALGNTVGKGDGRKAATIGGAVIGGAIGHDVAKNSDPNYVPSGCRMVEVGGDSGPPSGFDVEYDYKGDVYVARMPYDPGNRIRVRVSVVPADEAPRYRR